MEEAKNSTKVREIKKKLTKLSSEERTMKTPKGSKRFRITRYKDSEGNTILEIEGLETEDYILIPEKTLKQILQEAQEKLAGNRPKNRT